MNWQPINTAPKDGTRILLFCPATSIDVGYWSKSVWVEPPGAWIIYEARSDTVELNPTHWMPLSEPPKEVI